MFKGKITIIKNINGKEEKIEKEFDSPEQYEEFMRKYDTDSFFRIPDIKLSLPEWSALGRLIENVFDNRFDLLPKITDKIENEYSELPVDIKKYEKEAQKIKQEKQKKEEKKKQIKNTIEKLKEYVKTFEKEGEKELAESAKKDIKKLQEELKKL